MNITLHTGTTTATITTDGAYITSLADERGDVFYPLQQLATSDGARKTRGGCHVCLPNFGPGGASGLAQHGFGRSGPVASGGAHQRPSGAHAAGGAMLMLGWSLAWCIQWRSTSLQCSSRW